ncbi:MAG: 50S ribosomal protein L21 [Bacillota bacterium]
MYAIFETGGKQYRVSEGDVIRVEKLNLEEGDTVTFDRVLLVSKSGKVRTGTPTVEGARIEAKVLEQGKGPKILVFKYKSKVQYRKRKGHRQPFTRVQIEKIVV